NVGGLCLQRRVCRRTRQGYGSVRRVRLHGNTHGGNARKQQRSRPTAWDRCCSVFVGGSSLLRPIREDLSRTIATSSGVVNRAVPNGAGSIARDELNVSVTKRVFTATLVPAHRGGAVAIGFIALVTGGA